MEENVDSDVSDSWSIVEDKIEDVRSSTDSGLCSEKLMIAGQQTTEDNLDECYELTEITDPLGVNKKKLDLSDIDSDGISVISDDEESNWQKTAHENYKISLKVLETPPRPTQIEPEETFQQKLFNFWKKNLLAFAVVVAIACIALAQYFKTDPNMEKLLEMLENLEKLKIENQKLNIQLQSLTLAYTTLKTQIASEKKIKTEPIDPVFDELAQLLEKFAQKDPEMVEKIQNHIKEKPKFVNQFLRILKRGGENLQQFLSKLTEKKRHKKRTDGLKIVQWFPEEAPADPPLEYPIPVIQKTKKRTKKMKTDCENQNKTGMWYLERGKGRESSRKSDEQKDWQFARGRRDVKREYDDKSMWYLRRLDLNTRSRQ